MTNAEKHAQDWQKGKWSRARKTRRCGHFFTKKCLGDGDIAAGSLYFDTQELNGEAGGFGTHHCCASCANGTA